MSGVRYRQSPQRPPVLLTTLEDREVVVVPAAVATVFGLQSWDSPSFSMHGIEKHLRLSDATIIYN